MELREKNDPELSEVADYVFENVFLHYTMKQWGQTPDEIDPCDHRPRARLRRATTIATSQDAPFQGMPAEGYTQALREHARATTIISVCAPGVDARDIDSLWATPRSPSGGKPYGGRGHLTPARSTSSSGSDLGRAAVPHPRLRLRDAATRTYQLPCGTVNYTA